MPTYFVQSTPLAGLERMMMTPPNHRPRGGGISICRYKPTATDCDCRYCVKAEKRKRHCHGVLDCVCFEERLTANCWTHGELAQRLIREVRMPKLSERTRQLLPRQTTTPFLRESHRQRMQSITAAAKREYTPYTAAAFLLSSDPTLWKKSRPALREIAVDFNRIDSAGTEMRVHTLLQAAKDLYHGTCRLTTGELCDRELISDELFRLIVSAFVIRRYGLTESALQ
ncbi:hypothetical protein LJC60_04110 [Ruminococcaceae bacterium OttesenSCG-928-D13]|nr:hypothetical protein [Ruminococcaceae bacterium OttesenSCG-928-D13]